MKQGIILVAFLWCQIALYAQVAEQTIKDHVYYLSSEELNGRIAGTKESRMAADYIANEFKTKGLEVFSDTSVYYQDFTRSRTYAKPSYLTNGVDTFLVAHLNKDKHFQKHPKIKFADDNTEALKDSNVFITIRANNFEEGMQLVKSKQASGVNNGFILLLSNKKKKSFRINLKSLKKSKSAQEVYVLTNYLHFAHDKKACEDYLKQFEASNVFVTSEKSFSILKENSKNPEVGLDLHEESDSLVVTEYRNVISKIEGRNAKAPAIVFCAHYDHVDSLYSRKTKGVSATDYFPGADDNASGTAAVVELAKSLKSANYQPEQTIYFCLFDAEEKGLYGSRHFAKNIVQDVDLVINMDMIGRNKRDRKRCDNIIFARSQGKTGKDFIKGFDIYCRENAESLKIRRYDMDLLLMLMGYPSDQASFRPDSDTSVFYTGLHKDYHTHNDTPDKINYKKLTEYINMMSGYLMSR